MEAACREARPARSNRPFERPAERRHRPERSRDRGNERPGPSDCANERSSLTDRGDGRSRRSDRSRERSGQGDRVNEKSVPASRVNERPEDRSKDRVADFYGNRAAESFVNRIPDRMTRLYSEEVDSEEEEEAGEEVCVWVDERQLWVSGVLAHTTCGELVRALLPHRGEARAGEADWVIAECWRSMEQPLDNGATILDIWNAWGDAQSEIRFTLRYVDSSGDSGRGSPPSPQTGPPRRRHPPHRRRTRQLFPQLLQAQGDTLQMQADRLREQDRQISHLEEQTHKTRMEKHGPNYLLESYLRDIARNNDLTNTEEMRDQLAGLSDLNIRDDHKSGEVVSSQENSPLQSGEAADNHARSSEATDSPAANSDSGVGVSGSPPRATKRRSRGRHLLREHYLTKELADICQINANRIVQTKSDDNSETSSDELSRIQQQIDILEKLAIVNKRLQREEELIVRLGVKLRRYLCEDQISYIESEDQIVSMLNTLRSQMDYSSKEIENAAIEMERADYQLEKRKNILDILYKEMEDVELENQTLEVQINTLGESEQQMFTDVQYVGMQQPYNDNTVCTLPLDISKNQFVNVNYNIINSVPNYSLDTLV